MKGSEEESFCSTKIVYYNEQPEQSYIKYKNKLRDVLSGRCDAVAAPAAHIPASTKHEW